jgi:hypothetical protein
VAIKKVFQDKKYKNRELSILKVLNHPNCIFVKNSFYSSGDKVRLYLKKKERRGVPKRGDGLHALDRLQTVQNLLEAEDAIPAYLGQDIHLLNA